ncbi:MAG: TonB family protein [Thermoanaerobaculia bacterium]|nr:TonB family protein [Thermoanaerobaculia bacterium]
MPLNAAKPYARLGAFVMFHKLDTDALGETWRAGLLEPPKMGPVLATRKLAGNREAWAANFPSARLFAEKITGATLAKGQRFEVVDGQPVVAWEYAGGRSLAHLVAAAVTAHNPIPIDQAIAIAEKVASALEAINSVKQEGKRLVHGAVVPQFVWISEDGDVRVAGQLLGKGLIASLSNPTVAKEAGPFVAPELRGGGEATKASDVYAAGAILYLAVTGQAPPEPTSGKVIEAVQKAVLMHSDEKVPADVRAILEKALATDPAARFDGPTELHKALSELLNKGQYAPTTFNLAFYVHNLLRSEMEAEQKEREQESKLAVEPYLQDLERQVPSPAPAAPAARPQPAPAPAPAPAPMFGSATFEQPKQGGSKLPLIAGGVALVAAAAVGGWYFLGRKEQPAPPPVAQAAPAPATETVAAPVAAPVLAALPGQEQPAATSTDEEARKKAIEDEINRRLAEEMRKLQDDYNKQLKKQQDASGKPVAATQTTPAVTQPPAQTAPAVAQQAPPQPATATQAPVPAPATATQAPVPVAAAQQPPAAVPPPPAAPAAVQTGDFVASTELDQAPRPVKRVAPVYPPMAARQRLTGEVILSILINETGKVQEVRVLRVDKKGMGFEAAAVTAVKQFTFEPGVKDGKKVKTWMPIPFVFR